jgi:GT2 family glycosyltransferase
VQIGWVVTTYGHRLLSETILSIPKGDHYFIYNGDNFPSWSALLNQAIKETLYNHDVAIIVHDDVVLEEGTGEELVAALDYLDMAMAFDKDHPETQSQSNAFCFTITPKLVEKIGYFDEGFEKYLLEDMDYFRRIELAGLIAKSVTGVTHYGGISARKLMPNEHEIWVQNYVRYVIKWGGVVGEEKFLLPFNGLTEADAVEVYSDSC